MKTFIVFACAMLLVSANAFASDVEGWVVPSYTRPVEGAGLDPYQTVYPQARGKFRPLSFGEHTIRVRIRMFVKVFGEWEQVYDASGDGTLSWHSPQPQPTWTIVYGPPQAPGWNPLAYNGSECIVVVKVWQKTNGVWVDVTPSQEGDDIDDNEFTINLLS